jgi:hypothetical protein
MLERSKDLEDCTKHHTYRIRKESAHMSLVDHPISQSSLDISFIWTPIFA